MSGCSNAVAAPRFVRQSVHSVSRSHVGRVRLVNEDRIFDDAAAGVWAVADGMGGHSGGDLAAQQVVDCLRQTVASSSPIASGDVHQALLAANRLIHGRNQQLRLDAGATAVAACLADGWLDIAWAGDSRAYRLRDGRAELLTHDHSLVQQLIDAGLLTPIMAERHPQANVVTRALGVEADLAMDTVRVEADAGRFLLCSDGLSRSLREEDFSADMDLVALADRLVANALERDGTDNVSLVLIQIAADQ